MVPNQSVPSLEIRLFGPFEARVNGRPLPRLRSRKVLWLLALLVLRSGAELEREWLAALLWPDSSASQGLANLRLALKDLRRALGAEAPRLRSPTPRTLSFDPTGAEIDIKAFDQAIAVGNDASLERATALYRGPLLQGCVEEWAFQERQVREQAYLQALERLAEDAIAARDASAAERWLRRAVATDPMRETAHRTLMRALAESGSYAAALLAYRELREHLRRAVNAEPDPETRSLFRELRAEARRRAEAADDSTWPDLPSGLCSPEVIQLRPHNLPAQVTPLLGREQELAAVQSLLRRDTARLVTLTGPGGTGKTRLGLQVAAELRDQFVDGVFFIDLAPIGEPGLLAATVAQTLGVRETAGQSLADSLKEYLRNKQLLLLVDNFEHVLPAGVLVAELLAGCPRLKVLATSRASLHLRGEHEFPVTPLALPPLPVGTGQWVAGSKGEGARARLSSPELPADHRPLTADLSQYAAVELFIQRARAAQAWFAVTNANAPAVAEICHRLDGLPLAIELAAARIKLFPPEALLSRLEYRLELLTGGPRDLPARQRTLRRAIAWSYDLLDAPEQALFRCLSVFAGGCTLDTVEAVCEGVAGLETTVLRDGIECLVDNSLIYREAGESVKPRFRMLETIREYAAERLAETDAASAVRSRHARFFLELPSRRHSDCFPQEHNNLRAALSWLIESDDLEPAFRLADMLGGYWNWQGHWTEGRQRLARLLAHPRAPEFPKRQAKTLYLAAQAAWYQGDLEAARRLIEEEAAIGRALGHNVIIGDALFQLGMLEMSLGNLEAGRAAHQENVTAARLSGDPERLRRGLHGLGTLAEIQGDGPTAQTYYNELLTLSRSRGEHYLATWWLHGLGVAALLQGDDQRARALLEESLAQFREFGDLWAVAKTLNRLATVVWKQGAREQAVDLCRESLQLSWKAGDREQLAMNLDTLAGWAAAEQQMERAARLFSAADALREAFRIPVRPADRAGYDHNLSRARVSLGEEAFATAWAQGQTTFLKRVLAEIIQDRVNP